MTTWNLRRALSAEADRLTEIAHAAKRHWRYPESWIRSWRQALTLTPSCIALDEVFVACRPGDEVGEESLGGFYVLKVGGAVSSLEHLWVDPPWIGQGLGRLLLEHAVRQARESDARSIEVVSDPNASGFYERMGARRVGEHQGAPLDGQPRMLPVYQLAFEA